MRSYTGELAWFKRHNIKMTCNRVFK